MIRRTKVLTFGPAEKKMPSAKTMAKNVIKDGGSILKSGFKLVDSKTFDQRIKTCTDCEHVRVRGEEIRCSICGCYMKRKAQFEVSKCPKKLWAN